MIRVLVVDDHPIFRDGLRTALSELPGIELCGEAGSAAEALELVASLVPDVVLMDLDLGDGSGIDVTAQITQELPGVAVVVLTMHDAEASVYAALCAGAVGYLLKGVDQDALERAVRAAGAGEAVFGAGMARRVLMRLGDAARGHHARTIGSDRSRDRDPGPDGRRAGATRRSPNGCSCRPRRCATTSPPS